MQAPATGNIGKTTEVRNKQGEKNAFPEILFPDASLALFSPSIGGSMVLLSNVDESLIEFFEVHIN